MSGQSNSPLEPFVERTEIGTCSYRFGYRCATTKQVLSIVTIPAKMVELALTESFSLTTKITPAGDVIPVLAGPDDVTIAPGAIWTATPVEQLVADAISAENLYLEEAGRAELNILRQRLEHAIGLVTEALRRPIDAKKAPS
ncbi:hypothetical protein JQ620_25855 [Bradyrhizobium sp. AUGA SZCCT0274]|uniref:hypothetical protein n=1 Tax=Bradyrhizobium sp. AUGA SZCCT0274 TaxID=2807670 RepID=UPI001BA81BB3|nr:hypothetical protein [Bradyrhizobium sp. AUGA SZCCT0274]MBR1243522.1 hypothetical protein [Bradyrhizobium sp. AUGA SZCCT0274]